MEKELPEELVQVEYDWECPVCGESIEKQGTLRDKARFIEKTHAHMETHN